MHGYPERHQRQHLLVWVFGIREIEHHEPNVGKQAERVQRPHYILMLNHRLEFVLDFDGALIVGVAANLLKTRVPQLPLP